MLKRFAFLLSFTLMLPILMALKPDPTYKIKPSDFGLKFRELSVLTEDGSTLKSWFFSPKNQSGTLVVISGDGNSNMSSMIEMASQFVTLGVNVVTYDYRGFGESSAFDINSTFYLYPQFEKDLQAVIDASKKSGGTISKIILYGKGMGAGLSIGVAGGRRDVIKVIADSPYSTLEQIQKRYAESGQEIMIPLAFNKESIEPFYALQTKISAVKNFLFIYGEKDKIYTSSDIKSLAKVNKDQITLYGVKNSDYAGTFSSNKAEYFEQIKNFIK